MNKLTYTTTKVEKNTRTPPAGLWYGGRPIIGYRKTLDPACVTYGNPMKMYKTGCNTCTGPVGSKYGNVISFSGGSGIRSATTNLSPTYYSDTKAYLRSRGQSYTSNVDIHKAPGIEYANAQGPIPPGVPQTGGNSSLWASNIPAPRCPTDLCVYKPNNSEYAVQGAVSSGTRILKLRTDANNAPQLSAYEKKRQKLTLPPQPYWGTLG